MALRIGDLLLIMEANKIRLPREGTGRGKQIVARDIEHAIGSHFLDKYHQPNSPFYKHMELRRHWVPMKAYRFNKLKPADQASLFEDNNEWVAEEKENGWRMMISFIPGTTPMFWGGNLSTVNFLPTNYTDHILLTQGEDKFENKSPATDIRFKSMIKKTCILDCEVVVTEDGEELSGHASLIRVQEILGSNPDRSKMTQRDSTLVFKVFDCIDPLAPSKGYTQRRMDAVEVLADLSQPAESYLTQFKLIPIVNRNKKAYVNKIWKRGGEGIILKHVLSTYNPGSRLRTHQIKVKRNHSEMVGDDIDAWISNTFNTPEWDKVGLIGGVELSLYLKTARGLVEHVIAHVSSMPDAVRQDITDCPDAYLDKVVVCDGQELSSRNKRLLHAKVDWVRGIRTDKNLFDCTMGLEEIEGVKF